MTTPHLIQGNVAELPDHVDPHFTEIWAQSMSCGYLNTFPFMIEDRGMWKTAEKNRT
jgi:hypothetical protein